MQFSTVSLLLALCTSALADLHGNAICVDSVGDYSVYNDAATRQSCTAYLNRNTGGTNQWDTCPDCEMITTGIPHCQSNDKHMGGDEITYYCKQAGANNALTS